MLGLQTVSWGENVEVPPESDDDEYGTDNGEEGYAGDDGEGSGEDASNLDAIADGFVDDDFLKSDDDDDDNDDGGGGGGNGSCRNKEKRAVGHTKDLSVLSHLEESPREQAIASNWTAARASDTRKVKASAPTTLRRTRRELLKVEVAKWVGPESAMP